MTPLRIQTFIALAGRTPSPRRGEGWGEGARRSRLFRAVSRQQQLLANGFENDVGVGKHVVVPEAQHAIAVCLDDRSAGGIVRGIMLPAVQLNRQPCGAAGEIGDIAVDLQLSDEPLPFEAAGAKTGPKAFLSIGLVGAQLAGDRSQALPSHLSTPSPNPLPAGERAYCGAFVNA